MSELSLRRSTRSTTTAASSHSLPSAHEDDVETRPSNSAQDLAFDPLEEAHHFHTPGQPYTTPAKNSDKSRSISRAAKENLKKNILLPLRCSITHEEDPAIAIQVYHVIPKAIELASVRLNIPADVIFYSCSFQVERLQYHWDLEKYNVNTHENLFYRMFAIVEYLIRYLPCIFSSTSRYASVIR